MPALRWRSVQAMNFSKPSTVVGGGEMKRETSSVVSSANSEAASRGAQFTQHDLPAAQRRQRLLPVALTDGRSTAES